MLINRLTDTDEPGIIYHYCSGATFQNIINNKTLRFSDMNLLNDAEEGRWGYNVFIEAADRILKRVDVPNILPLIEEAFIDRIDKIWHDSSFSMSSFLCCFSHEGDSLSQWRAYADDGRGFAIGFAVEELRRLPIQILNVLYDKEEQLREMILAIGAMYMEMEEHQRHDDEKWFLEREVLLKHTAVAFKNPAWRDEKEVRCQHVVMVDLRGDVWTIEAAGEGDGEKSLPLIPISFQTRAGGVIVSYFDMPFSVTAETNPIKEIWFGPKNPNGYGNVAFLLGNNGYGKIDFKYAGGAYR